MPGFHPFGYVTLMRLSLTGGILLASLLASACNRSGSTEAPAPGPTDGPPLYQGMGTHHRTVTTSNPEAQRYFDQGVAFLHGFNHDEAIRSFERAAAIDPDCAMAHFGIALALGPHINNPAVPPENEQRATEAVARAAAIGGGTDVERELIAALATRYQHPAPTDRRPLDEAFAKAMGEVWSRHADDSDVGAWYAEALMDLRPWDLWQPDGSPQPGTEDILAVLEAVMKIDPDHPLALHLYIHAVEASPEPGRADAVADALRDLVPAHGHLQHMPSHIDVRRGRWAQAAESNRKAIEADRVYREQAPEQNFYRLYMAHNRHMLTFAAMMSGRSAEAIQTIDAATAEIPMDWAIENPGIADGYMAMPLEVRMRFGRWDEILAAADFPEQLPLARALRHYARGVALAAQKRPDEARKELDAFRSAAAAVTAEARFGNNSGVAIVGVAEKLLEGEVLYREGAIEEGIASLREAIAREDALAYDEPPDWIQPVRHTLGAVLLEQKRPAEAEAVYLEDLTKQPENGWALWGLARSMRLQGRDEDAQAVDERLQRVWSEADIELHSSCMCLPGV